MVEYLHDAIRASAGTNIIIQARVLDEFNNEVKENVYFIICDKEDQTKHLIEVEAFDGGEALIFEIPAEITKDFKGRYWYCIKHNNEQMCFLQPIYFV